VFLYCAFFVFVLFVFWFYLCVLSFSTLLFFVLPFGGVAIIDHATSNGGVSLSYYCDFVGYRAAECSPGLRVFSSISGRLRSLSRLQDRLNAGVDWNTPLSDFPPYVGAAVSEDRVAASARGAILSLHLARLSGLKSRLDINLPIDHVPPVGTLVSRYFKEWPVRKVMERFGLEAEKAPDDKWVQLVRQWSRDARRAEYIARLSSEVAYRHSLGWYMVFDTLTIDPAREDAFFEDGTAMRDHFRSIGRLVNVALGRRSGDSFEDVFKYFAVPEYGDSTGRLHYHCVYLMAALPLNTADPNIGRFVRNRREVGTLKTWRFGFSAPIALRYSGDAFSRDGWYWPVTKGGKAMPVKPLIAVVRYVIKYVSKSVSGREKWVQSKPHGSAFRIRMSRKLGMVADTSSLSSPALLELASIHHSVHPSSRLLRRIAYRGLSLRLGSVSIASYTGGIRPRTTLLAALRDLTRESPVFRPPNFMSLRTPTLRRGDISDELAVWLDGLPVLEGSHVALSAK